MFIVVILTFDGMCFLALSVSIGWLKGTCSVICPFFHGKIGISPAIHWEEWMFPGCFCRFSWEKPMETFLLDVSPDFPSNPWVFR